VRHTDRDFSQKSGNSNGKNTALFPAVVHPGLFFGKKREWYNQKNGKISLPVL